MTQAPQPKYLPDDLFLLGNIAFKAVMQGRGESALPILSLMQKARPSNAGSFLVQSMYLYSLGETEKAIRFLEESNVFQAASNRDEAIAFHLFLLQENGEDSRAEQLGQAYLDEDLVTSPAAIETIRIVAAECMRRQGKLHEATAEEAEEVSEASHG